MSSAGAMTRQPDSLQQDRQQSDTLAATPLAEKQTSGSCAPVAGQKTFRDLYVQSFTAAFSTDLFKLQEVRHVSSWSTVVQHNHDSKSACMRNCRLL